MTVDDGTDVRLNCSATGFPSPSYQWRKLDGVIPSTAIGVNSSTLLLPGIGEEGGGVYTCSATNFIGSAESSSIQITVIPPFYGKSLVVHGIRWSVLYALTALYPLPIRVSFHKLYNPNLNHWRRLWPHPDVLCNRYTLTKLQLDSPGPIHAIQGSRGGVRNAGHSTRWMEWRWSVCLSGFQWSRKSPVQAHICDHAGPCW